MQLNIDENKLGIVAGILFWIIVAPMAWDSVSPSYECPQNPPCQSYEMVEVEDTGSKITVVLFTTAAAFGIYEMFPLVFFQSIGWVFSMFSSRPPDDMTPGFGDCYYDPTIASELLGFKEPALIKLLEKGTLRGRKDSSGNWEVDLVEGTSNVAIAAYKMDQSESAIYEKLESGDLQGYKLPNGKWRIINNSNPKL
ncbi:MAG: hypothetical protein ISR48_01605 [Alphaproteobacteria bacterium]|nr:hypothetical protein [Alphaproteobacteria bacterium]